MAAIVLAGGAGSRLGGVNKPALVDAAGRSSLRRVLDGCVGAWPVVVVGPDELVRESLISCDGDVPGLRVVCERPAGSGPARAVAAGVGDVCAAECAPQWTIVTAGDMPCAGQALKVLRQALSNDCGEGLSAPADRRGNGSGAVVAPGGVIATADGRRQWLLAIARTAALAKACAALPPWTVGQRGESMRAVLGNLDLREVAVPADAAADLDEWAQVERLGFARSEERNTNG
ncbi:MAG: nucleotidyltransferase family protein [Propionibacteriaceae bacterium]|nr:nucleotidyltransferase family protein [Propionibacteriaceae bacterium]